jgi:hypothetical protein
MLKIRRSGEGEEMSRNALKKGTGKVRLRGRRKTTKVRG